MQRILLLLIALLFSFSSYALDNPGYLGISVKTYELNAQQGLRIVNVFDGGAALLSGIKENDFIIKINEFYVATPIELKNILNQFEWGDAVELSLIRDGESITKSVVLGYKTVIRTYEILKTEKLGNIENWYFKDNSTVVFKNQIPISFTKKINGIEETIELENNIDFEELPQKFLDLSDKLFIIKSARDDQAERNVTANNMVVIKEIVPSEKLTQIIESIDFSEFKVYPNPSNGIFDVHIKANNFDKNLKWNIYDIQGRSILNGIDSPVDGSFDKHFNLTGIASGTYLFYLKSGDQKATQKFIIN